VTLVKTMKFLKFFNKILNLTIGNFWQKAHKLLRSTRYLWSVYPSPFLSAVFLHHKFQARSMVWCLLVFRVGQRARVRNSFSLHHDKTPPSLPSYVKEQLQYCTRDTIFIVILTDWYTVYLYDDSVCNWAAGETAVANPDGFRSRSWNRNFFGLHHTT
jgi:hypothetical protein